MGQGRRGMIGSGQLELDAQVLHVVRGGYLGRLPVYQCPVFQRIGVHDPG